MDIDLSGLEGLSTDNEFGRRGMANFAKAINGDYRPNWHHLLLCKYLDDFFEGRIKRLMVFMPPQEGKLLPANTPVLTTKGWKCHGNLAPGDFVFGQDGQPKAVIANSGVYLWPVQRVNFKGGKSILAAKEHLWKLQMEYDDHKRRRECILETQQIFSKKTRRSPAIEINRPLSLPEQGLPIDPYVLGCWLGDGHSKQGVLTVGKQDIKHFSKLGEAREVKPGIYRVLIPGLTTKLRAIGLLGNKHIPMQYLLSSEKQRMQLLQGIMDTDGTVCVRGKCEFSQKEGQLYQDVYTLLRTLGYGVTYSISDAKIAGKTVGTKVRMRFVPDKNDPVFRLPRKLARLRNKTQADRGDKKKIFIDSITDERTVPGNCIQVEGGMYLAGKDLIPTHNSELTSRLFPAYMLGRRPNTKIVLGSYAADIAEKFNRDVQRYIDSPRYNELFPQTKLSDRNNGGVYVRNTTQFDVVGYKGFLKTVGVGGSLTGTPADFAIIDDPHKDMAEAQSPIMQERVWDWYNDVVTTRLHNGSGILLIQTRWDVGDLAGRILQKVEENKEFSDSEQWTILSLQAIKEAEGHPEDPRKVGEALWPERHDLTFLNKQRRRNPRGFQHLYQQNPMPVQAGGEAYNCFTMASVGEYQYNPELSLHASFDFNVNPYMSCSIWQIEKLALPLKTYYKARMIREICLKSPRNNTKAICAEIRRLFPGHENGIYIYGDPNGFKEDTRSETGYNDYTIICQELKGFSPKMRVMMKAPSVRKRIEFMNALFSGGYDGLEIGIDRGCTRAIEDFQYVKEDADGTKLKQKVRDPITGVQAERYGHMSDNAEYFICGAFPNTYQKFLNGGNVSKITVGARKPRHNY